MKFIFGLIISLAIIVLIRFSIIVLGDIFGYPINLVIVFGSILLITVVVLFTVHTINKNKIIKLKEEGKWVEPKVELKNTKDDENAPKPNTKIILTVGLLALILIPGLAFFLRTL